jgi:hypothetical protein
MKYTIEMIQDDIDDAEPQTTQDGPMNLAIERCIDDAHDSTVNKEFLVFYMDGLLHQILMSKKLQDEAHDFYYMYELTVPITFIIEIEATFSEIVLGKAYLKREVQNAM